MREDDQLAEPFEKNRAHLRAVAYRMLGSLPEAEDAVQEAWLRLHRADTSAVENLSGWLTTIVARVCLDMLRARKSRREDPQGAHLPEAVAGAAGTIDPEQELTLANSVGLALLVVLETLPPPERLAFVLHDMFAVPFEEIAGIVGRSPTAARQLASRGRRRVQGADTTVDPDVGKQKQIVDAFLAASRGGDFEALVNLLDPDVVMRADATAALRTNAPSEMRGAELIGRRAALAGARAAQPALVDGKVGVVVAPKGRLLMVLRFHIVEGKITEIEAVADPDRVSALDLAVLEA